MAVVPGASSLPVDIISFNGRLSGDEIKLDWVGENEINFHHYEVERSINGTSYFTIGQVQAANLRNYNYADNISNLLGRRVYYRLKKVDKDGRFTYTPVFSIHIPLTTKFNIYPNRFTSSNCTCPATTRMA